MELSTAQIIPILIYTENLHLHIPNDIIYKNKKSEEEIMSEISMISKKVQLGECTKISSHINGSNYDILFVPPNREKGINISSIVIVPKSNTIYNQIVLEANNCDNNNLDEMLASAIITCKQLIEIVEGNYAPIVMPLLPAMSESERYFQQLSKGCFELSNTEPYYRIDEQVIRIINESKSMLKDKYNIECSNKIFLNGYSASAVFAHRFALIHPEIVETACIGGAIGDIPIPTRSIGYPIGIEDFENIFGKNFDIDSYSKIKFRYYVGELEDAMKSDNRVDEDGRQAPMHDMSYFYKSVPTEVGKKQRSKLGKNIFERAHKTIEILKKHGIDIELTIIPGRSHNDNSGTGLNEYTVKIPMQVHNETCTDDKIVTCNGQVEEERN